MSGLKKSKNELENELFASMKRHLIMSKTLNLWILIIKKNLPLY